MWGHSLLSGFAGIVLSLVAPLANTALVAPTTGTVDCSLTVSQSGVASGTTVQLTWWTVNATSVTMSDNGNAPVTVNPSGSIPLTINANHSFALIARSAYDSKTCTASINSSTQTNNGPTCAISATPGTHYAGQGVQIVWYSQNATEGQVGGVGTVSGSQLSSGSATIYPQQSTTVSMQVRNNYGSNTCSGPIIITPRPTTTAQQPTYLPTTYAPTSYRPITYPSSGYSPSYSTNPYSSNALYPSPLYSSGWYPYPQTYSLTNSFNNFYRAGSPGSWGNDCGSGWASDGQGGCYDTLRYASGEEAIAKTSYLSPNGSCGDWASDGNGGCYDPTRYSSMDEAVAKTTYLSPNGSCGSWASDGSGGCYDPSRYSPGMIDSISNPDKYDYQQVFPGQSATDVIDGSYGSNTGISSSDNSQVGTAPSSAYMMNTTEYPDNLGSFSAATVQTGLISNPGYTADSYWPSLNDTSVEAGNSYYSGAYAPSTQYNYQDRYIGSYGTFETPTDGYIYNPDISTASFGDSNSFTTGGAIQW